MMLSKDKIQHFVFSLVLSVLFYVIFSDYIMALAISLSLGLLKELSDQLRDKNNYWGSAADIFFDILGAGAGVIIVKIIFNSISI